MSNSEALNPKRKVSNWVFVVGALILAYLVTYFGGLTSETSKTTFMGSVFKIDVINPAAVAVEFQLRNVGSENGIPDCIVKVQDVSGTYSGFDKPIMNNEVKPMETIIGNMTITIRNQGASFVTEGSVSCD